MLIELKTHFTALSYSIHSHKILALWQKHENTP